MAANGVAKKNGIDPSNYPRKQSRAINSIDVIATIPKRRQDVMRWDGWGYKNNRFVVKDEIFRFIGDSYPIDKSELPLLTDEVIRLFGVDLSIDVEVKDFPKKSELPESIFPQSIVDEITNLGISCSVDHEDRFFRSHGQTVHEVDMVKRNKIERIPDAVVWPTCHEEVEKIVELADKRKLVVIPYGGGTSVSMALQCPSEERRPIISLDTTQMNSILWVDEENMAVCCESGILGQDLERELKKLGFTVGHEPDSYEFSTVGGWVATRASGMKKNTYGNIEDIVVHARMITPTGTLEKGCRVPRLSCGPDFDHVIMGSEGSFGVITEVILKMRPAPKFTRHASIVFPDFESGVGCLREVARLRIQPSSIRLLDKNQRRFGQSMRSAPSFYDRIMDNVKRMYITNVKGMDYDELCIITMLFEGNDERELIDHELKINAIAADYKGIPAGGKNGERGYLLTFVIAYLRDVAYEYGIVGESFETSVPWDKAIQLYKNVEKRVDIECKKMGIHRYQLAYRLTQTYDTGCCLYFYFGFCVEGIKEPLHAYEYIEEKARDEILASGGSISHHHGVGKLRKKWYRETVSDTGVKIFNATKIALDPNNVFAVNNIVDD